MRFFLLVMISSTIWGCASSREQWIKDHCNPEGSYKIGVSDALRDRNSGRSALKQKCSLETLEAALANYDKGFQEKGGKVQKGHQYGQDFFKDLSWEATNDNPKKKKKDNTVKKDNASE